jgi:flagellar motor protein MotB
MAHDEHGEKGDGHGDGHEKKHKKHHHAAHPEHEHEEGWIVSFADNVLLMMGFFVILFALNVQPKGGNPGGGGEESEGVAEEPDFVDFAISVRKAFHTLDDLDPNKPEDQKLIQRMEQQQGAGESRDDGAKGNDRNVKSVRDTNHFGKGTMVNFALRSTTLDEAAGVTLTEFAKKHRGRDSVIEIRGHASFAEGYKKSEEAMTIGFDRAMAAARALEAGGIPWHRLRVVSAGDNERAEAFPGEDETDARNARVEVRVTNEVAAPLTPTEPTRSRTPSE